MRVLFCGDRYWTDEKLIEKRLKQYNPIADTIIHGNAKGADKIAGRLAYNMGFVIEPYPAKWEEYGKKAGPIRNKQMLDSGIDQVEAFHEDIERSKGTKGMITISLKASVPVNLNGYPQHLKIY